MTNLHTIQKNEIKTNAVNFIYDGRKDIKSPSNLLEILKKSDSESKLVGGKTISAES